MRYLRPSLLVCQILVSSIAIAQQAALDQDARVIEILRQNGSDLAKPHAVDFFFLLPAESAATAVAKELQSAGYSLRRVHRSAKTNSWEVHAQRLMVPELAVMQATTITLTALARKYGGIYDGWGAPVAK